MTVLSTVLHSGIMDCGLQEEVSYIHEETTLSFGGEEYNGYTSLERESSKM